MKASLSLLITSLKNTATSRYTQNNLQYLPPCSRTQRRESLLIIFGRIQMSQSEEEGVGGGKMESGKVISEYKVWREYIQCV